MSEKRPTLDEIRLVMEGIIGRTLRDELYEFRQSLAAIREEITGQGETCGPGFMLEWKTPKELFAYIVKNGNSRMFAAEQVKKVFPDWDGIP